MNPDTEPVTIEGVLRAVERETVKLDSLQSLCAVVAETTDVVSGPAMAGALFSIMNSVEAIKDGLAEAVHQLMTLRREGARAPRDSLAESIAHTPRPR